MILINVAEYDIRSENPDKPTATLVLDEETGGKERFIELYGEADYRLLTEWGSVGDTIGQGRWYRALRVNERGMRVTG